MLSALAKYVIDRLIHGLFRISSRGYQELCQVHFCRVMFVDIADMTVPNLIYALKNEMLTS